MYSNVFNIIQIQGNFSYVSTHLELVWCFCLFRSVYPWAEAMLDDVGQRPSSSGPFDPPFHVVALANTIRFKDQRLLTVGGHGRLPAP